MNAAFHITLLYDGPLCVCVVLAVCIFVCLLPWPRPFVYVWCWQCVYFCVSAAVTQALYMRVVLAMCMPCLVMNAAYHMRCIYDYMQRHKGHDRFIKKCIDKY